MVFNIRARQIPNACIERMVRHCYDSNIATSHSNIDFQMLVVKALARLYLLFVAQDDHTGVVLAGAANTKVDSSKFDSMRSD